MYIRLLDEVDSYKSYEKLRLNVISLKKIHFLFLFGLHTLDTKYVYQNINCTYFKTYCISILKPLVIHVHLGSQLKVQMNITSSLLEKYQKKMFQQ